MIYPLKNRNQIDMKKEKQRRKRKKNRRRKRRRINQYNLPYQQNEEEKLHDPIS